MPWDFNVCDLGGQNLPLRYTLASEKLIIWKSPVWTFASKLSYSSFPCRVGAGREVCLKRLLLQEVPGFSLECLINKTSPKSLTFWWMNTPFWFLSSKWEKQQVTLMLAFWRLLKCCPAFKLNKSSSVAFYIFLCVYVHCTLAWHFVNKSYFLSNFVSDFKLKGREEYCTIRE